MLIFTVILVTNFYLFNILHLKLNKIEFPVFIVCKRLNRKQQSKINKEPLI